MANEAYQNLIEAVLSAIKVIRKEQEYFVQVGAVTKMPDEIKDFMNYENMIPRVNVLYRSEVILELEPGEQPIKKLVTKHFNAERDSDLVWSLESELMHI